MSVKHGFNETNIALMSVEKLNMFQLKSVICMPQKIFCLIKTCALISHSLFHSDLIVTFSPAVNTQFLFKHVFNQVIIELNQDAREGGCRDSCPSKAVLKQFRYESRKIATPPGDVWLALQSIKKNQNQMTASSATLQAISVDPPAVIFLY